jgi:serine/threonine protein kinase
MLPYPIQKKRRRSVIFEFIRGQAEKDFRMEVQTIGRVRHKNLVSLLGYCSEGACRYSAITIQCTCPNLIDSILSTQTIYCCGHSIRMLVYQYMENRNLDKWLHHDDSEISPLTWEIRMRILLGTSKGYRFLLALFIRTSFAF